MVFLNQGEKEHDYLCTLDADVLSKISKERQSKNNFYLVCCRLITSLKYLITVLSNRYL